MAAPKRKSLEIGGDVIVKKEINLLRSFSFRNFKRTPFPGRERCFGVEIENQGCFLMVRPQNPQWNWKYVTLRLRTISFSSENFEEWNIFDLKKLPSLFFQLSLSFSSNSALQSVFISRSDKFPRGLVFVSWREFLYLAPSHFSSHNAILSSRRQGNDAEVVE